MTENRPGTRNPQINTLLLPISNSSLQEHICSDGHPDWGDGTDCPNCAIRGGRSSWNSEIARANADGRWDTWGGDGVGP